MKQRKTYTEQIILLKLKGLLFKDEEYAKQILKDENYYFLINAYQKNFLKGKDVYMENIYFDEIYALFKFDRKISSILMHNILMVENRLKSAISYTFAQNEGNDHKKYLITNSFEKPTNIKVIELVEKINNYINHQKTRSNSISHYINTYGFIPQWVLFRGISFGTMSELFNFSKKEERDVIWKSLKTKLSKKDLRKSLTILNFFRNESAHLGRIYNFKITNNNFWIRTVDKMSPSYKGNGNDFFTVLIILKQLLKNFEYKELLVKFQSELELLELNINTTSFEKIKTEMGLPENWQEIENL